MPRLSALLVAVALLLIPLRHLMALDVAGPIDVDTTWTSADSPIHVTGDIIVLANLSIEPGVVVRFAAGTELVLESGAIRALGTETAPIVFDSNQANPAAGDWGPVRIEDGSSDYATAFDWVVIRHGKGLAVHSASPALNRVAFENHVGAAITLDLASSPVGTGLTATGNGLNGIAIPPGTVAGIVRWGLVGIPYVVADGVVTVGLPPMTMVPVTRELREGQQATFTLQLAKPAPTGGLVMDLVSSAPNVVSVSSQLAVPGGAIQATVSIAAIAAGVATVTVSRLELGAVSAAVTVRPPIAIELVPTSTTLAVGQSGVLTVRLSESAPPGGAVIALLSSNPVIASVPATAFLPQGHSAVSFTVQAHAIGSATLSASAAGYIGASANVLVRDLFLSFVPVGVLQPNRSHSLTLNISAPAPPGGVTVNITSSQTSVLRPQPSVFVAPGATSAPFLVEAENEGTATLTATKLGYEPASIVVVVQLIQLSFDPGTGTQRIPVDGTDRFVVRLNRPAMAGGLSVALNHSSGAPPTLSVAPAEIVIPEGLTASPTKVAVTGLRNGFGTVRARSPGVVGADLNIQLEGAASLRFDSASVAIGRGTLTRVELSRRRSDGSPYHDRDPAVVTLVSSDPQRLPLPATVTIAAGSYSAWLALVPSSAPLASEPVGIVAAAPSLGSATMQTSITDPGVAFDLLDGIRAVGAARDDFAIAIAPAGQSVALQAIEVDLGIDEPMPPGVVDGLFDSDTGGNPLSRLTIPAGGSYSSAQAYVGTPTVAGSYRLSARIGMSDPSISNEQSVSDAIGLQFSTNEMRLARGMQSNALRVFRSLDGQEFAGADSLPVTLSISEPGKVDVPTTVEIPAMGSYADLPLVGLDVTAGPVTIQASAPGYAAPAEAVSVTVEPAIIELHVNTPQIVGDPRSVFSVAWEPNYKGDQLVSPIDRPASVTLVDRDPLGIVDGLYAASAGTEPPGPLTLRAGEYRLTDAQGEDALIYIGSPTAAGTYRVNVDVPGFGNWNSEWVTVEADGAPGLSFSRGSQVVGRGLRTQDLRVLRTRINLGQPLTIELASSAPDIVIVPPEVVIPAGEFEVMVPLSGMAVSVSPVVISAEVPGEPSLVASMTATVANPLITFRNLSVERGVGGERDAFSVLWSVPGPIGSNQVALGDTAVAIDIVGAPSGMIAGIYANSAGPAVRATLVIREGEAESTTPAGAVDQLYIGSPGVSGTYRVRASVSGLADSLSNLQSVTTPGLRFSHASHVVGTGLQSRAMRLQRAISSTGGVEAVAENLLISLNCISSSVCAVPATVTLPAGSTEVTVPIVGAGLGATRLAASAPGYISGTLGQLDVRVVPPTLTIMNAPEFLRVGLSTSLVVRAEVASSTEPLQPAAAAIQVTLISSFPGVAGISSPVVIAAGSTTSNEATLVGLGAGQTTLTPNAPNAEVVSRNVWILE